MLYDTFETCIASGRNVENNTIHRSQLANVCESIRYPELIRSNDGYGIACELKGWKMFKYFEWLVDYLVYLCSNRLK